jgi:periplasmic divalent cation tolerance protein
MPHRVSLVLCTVPAEEAEGLVQRILSARLAACVNLVGPVRSRYWWEGRVESAEEILLLMKVPADRVDALRERVVAWHSYDVPEFLEFTASSGLAAYLAWVTDSVAR